MRQPSRSSGPSAATEQAERAGWLKWTEEQARAVCIGGEGRPEFCYDFANELVRNDKLAMVREVLEDYEAEGLELDFEFDPDSYFRPGEIEE